MGCCDGGGGGGDNHTTTLFEYFEKVSILGIKMHIPGMKRRFEIRINKNESINDEYASGVEAYLLLGGKSIHRTFYDLNSPRAREILRKYQPKFA